jgi:NAD(P)H-dependent flavin oxidoreductase YrpB (nitropropane dioxygenase family)
MITKLTELFGIDFPLFAFSHCRDVVAAVTNAGGFGVLGASEFRTEQLNAELDWIDERVDRKPYGVDLVMPARQVARGLVDPVDYRSDFLAMIPESHISYVERLLADHGVPQLDDPDDYAMDATGLTHEGSAQRLEVALKHPISLLVNALGPMPVGVVERAHTLGIVTAGLVGSAEHAIKQVANGVDVVVAQGNEAGGHCGEISTMVLIPDVVDAVPTTPVLAAGGIGSGRQIAAALALGAEGVWTGSIWLTTAESGVTPVLRDRLLAAKSSDTVRSKAMTGKPARQLRSAWTEAWDDVEAPLQPLPMPLQTLLFAPVKERVERAGASALVGEAVGQIVGRMNAVQSARDLCFALASETADAVQRICSMSDDLQRPVNDDVTEGPC